MLIRSGAIFFNGASTGGTARVEVFDNGYLDISRRQPGVTIGSIEGSGNVFLGANRLTVGTRNINTSFSGVISGSGLLAKIGSGVLTLQSNHCIADTAGLILVTGSTIKLDFTGPSDAIASLKVNGVPQPPGIYGGPMSGAPNILPEFKGSWHSAGGPYLNSRKHLFAGLRSDRRRRDDWRLHCSRDRTKEGNYSGDWP